MSNETFRFTYSAAQQREVEQIRRHYLPPQEDKLARLYKLHNSATQKAQAYALSLGVVGTLLLGTGMSLIMTELPSLLSIHEVAAMILGILVGLLGLALAALAYPVYRQVLRRQREKLAPEILRLSDELLKGSDGERQVWHEED